MMDKYTLSKVNDKSFADIKSHRRKAISGNMIRTRNVAEYKDKVNQELLLSFDLLQNTNLNKSISTDQVGCLPI
jgi:hypothetical protein